LQGRLRELFAFQLAQCVAEICERVNLIEQPRSGTPARMKPAAPKSCETSQSTPCSRESRLRISTTSRGVPSGNPDDAADFASSELGMKLGLLAPASLPSSRPAKKCTGSELSHDRPRFAVAAPSRTASAWSGVRARVEV